MVPYRLEGFHHEFPAKGSLVEYLVLSRPHLGLHPVGKLLRIL